jgi:hypothetical protein
VVSEYGTGYRHPGGVGPPGLALPSLLGETQKQHDGYPTLRRIVCQHGVLSCALYLSVLIRR